MRSRLVLFLLAGLVWMLLAWTERGPAPGFEPGDILAGVAAAALTAAIFGRDFSEGPLRFLSPRRWLYAAGFVPVFAYSCGKASLQVFRMILNPDLPIKPGIVKIQSRLRNRLALTILANCITLTPGTLTVEATAEGELYIHWLTVETIEVEKATRMIAGRFEWWLERIFEPG